MVPFGEEAEDPYEIYEEIIKKDISYPNYLKDKKAKKLMDQLLSRVPEVRLGGQYATLKANPWFENFDWVRLSVLVPWVGRTANALPPPGGAHTATWNYTFFLLDISRILTNDKCVNFEQDKLLDKELKAPYLPPQEKLLKEEEVKQAEATNKLIVDEINVNFISLSLSLFKKAKARALPPLCS